MDCVVPERSQAFGETEVHIVLARLQQSHYEALSSWQEADIEKDRENAANTRKILVGSLDGPLQSLEFIYAITVHDLLSMRGLRRTIQENSARSMFS